MTYEPHPGTVQEMRHVAALVHALRRDWPEQLVFVVLDSHRQQCSLVDLAVAALRAAANPDLPTPKAIGWRGPHWQGATTKPEKMRDPDRCRVCNKIEPECWSQRPGVDDDHVFEAVPR